MNTEPQSIASFLIQSKNHETDVAFLLSEQSVYFVYFPKHELDRLPHSAITLLIQNIYETYSDQALRLLRNRIYSTLPTPSVMCYGMVKVAAKRLSCGIQPSLHDLQGFKAESYQWLNLTKNSLAERQSNLLNPMDFWRESNPPNSHYDFLSLTLILAAQVTKSMQTYLSDRSVACILAVRNSFDSTFSILMGAINTNSKNKSLHAEINLIQSFYLQTGQILPPNSILYSSLKPCRMCASMIWHCSADTSSLQVHYAYDDPGPHAKNTILSANSNDRRRFAPDAQLGNINLFTDSRFQRKLIT